MAGPASTEQEVLQYTDNHDRDLRAKVTHALNQGGHPTAVAEVNPEHVSPLDNIRKAFGAATKDSARVAGDFIEENTSGESPTTGVGVVENKEPLKMKLRMANLKKAA